MKTEVPICVMCLKLPRRLGANMKKYTLVVTKSTVPVGTARKVKTVIREGIGEKTEKLLAKLGHRDRGSVGASLSSLLHDLSRANFHIRDKDRTKMFD